MQLALVLLVIAALGGATVLTLRLRGGNPPLPLALLHGAVAASGLVALIVAVSGSGWTGKPFIALLLVGAAALGGLGLIRIHLSGKLIPVPFAVVHGLLALSGVVTLLLHVMG
jgi:hypothetical protein